MSPGAWRYGTALDLGVHKAYANIEVTRFIIGAYDAGGTSMASIERLVKRHQDEVLARL